MVLNNYKGGQLANRIISFAHLIANSIEYNYPLINPEFDEYEPFFEATSKNSFNDYPISVKIYKNKLTNLIAKKFIRLWLDITWKITTITPFYNLYRIFKTHDKQEIEFDLNEPSFIKNAQTKNVVVQGWSFRDRKNFIKHQDLLRHFFTPVDSFRQQVITLINDIRKEADIVIGVHIRRGDYSTFKGGKYLYSDEVYADKMLQLHNQYTGQNKTIAFFICSNETINKTEFPATLNLITGKRHFIIDLYGLALCDGIIGPPSSFSSWASFYGKVPIRHIQSKTEEIKLGNYMELV